MLGQDHGFRVVDTHARLDPDEEAVAVRGRDISPERLERELHDAGVVRAVVSPRSNQDAEGYLRANNAVARLSVDRPFVAFARIDGPRSPGTGTASRLRNLKPTRKEYHASPEDVEQYAYDDRFYGFTLDPGADGLPDRPVLEELDDVGYPLRVRASRTYPPEQVAETLLEFSFPVILESFGGFPLNRRRMETALSLLDDHDQLYVSTGLVGYRDVLEQGILEHPDRVLFGSGAPEVHPLVSVTEILTLDVSRDAMGRVFSKNAARVVPALAPGAA